MFYLDSMYTQQSFYYFDNSVEQIPNFQVGDEVEFEQSPHTGSALPRWSHDGRDSGATGKFLRGNVIAVTPEWIQVEYSADGYIGKGEAWFPYYKNNKYVNHQWKRKGYLMKVHTKEIKCDCGAAKTYGADTNLHSHWCSKKNV